MNTNAEEHRRDVMGWNARNRIMRDSNKREPNNNENEGEGSITLEIRIALEIMKEKDPLGGYKNF